jgi:hypothetical protein
VVVLVARFMVVQALTESIRRFLELDLQHSLALVAVMV